MTVRDLTSNELKHAGREVLAQWVKALQDERAAAKSQQVGDDRVLTTVAVVDISETARRLGMDVAAITGRPAPAHDYRFSMATPTGGEITFSRYCTADQIAAYCEREGWLPS